MLRKTKFSLLLLLPLTNTLLANETNTLIEKLEYQLLQKDSAEIPLNFTSQDLAIKKPQGKKIETNSQTSIIGQGSAQKEIISLQKNIDALKNRVMDLAAQLHRLNHSLSEGSKNDALVEISLDLTSLTKANLLDLSVQIDNHDLFSYDDIHEASMANNQVLIYRGPLSSGEHQVEISTRLGIVSDVRLPADQDHLQLADNHFTLDIPQGEVRREYKFFIELSPEKNQKAQIRLQEGPLNEE